jgi:hypothetical protein
LFLVDEAAARFCPGQRFNTAPSGNNVLAGDVGGTKCNLALVEKSGGKFFDRHQRRFVP